VRGCAASSAPASAIARCAARWCDFRAASAGCRAWSAACSSCAPGSASRTRARAPRSPASPALAARAWHGSSEQTTTIAAPAVGGPLARRGEPTGRGGVLGERKSSGDQPGKRSSSASSEQSAVLPIARPESGPGGGGSPMDLTIIIVPVALATFAVVLFRELRRQT
jgi:hypothetical protein